MVKLQGPSIAPVMIFNSLVRLSAAWVPSFIEVATADLDMTIGIFVAASRLRPESLSSDIVCCWCVCVCLSACSLAKDWNFFVADGCPASS